jgi:hypothetical protein
MKFALWVLLGLGVTGVAFWLVTSPWFPKNPVIETIVFAFFALPSVGAFWMLYVAVRFERNPTAYVFLAFIPYSFMWYYFERVRGGTLMKRKVG